MVIVLNSEWSMCAYAAIAFALAHVQVVHAQITDDHRIDSVRLLDKHRIDNVRWVDASSLSLVGRYLNTSIAPYRRLPADSKSRVRPIIWELAGNSAGFAVAFETNSTLIRVDYTLTSSSFGMFHMAPTGVSGVDLWALDDRVANGSGRWRWASTASPGIGGWSTHVQQTLVALEPLDASGWRPTRFVLYFPLYNGVENVSIGVEPASSIGPCGECGLGLDQRPIVWYGSSITQGACADKPGDAYTNAIGRALRVPVANFGFSGSCWFEPEVMEYLLNIDAQVFIIDCQPNTEKFGYKQIYAKARALVEQMRNRTSAPIVIASGTPEGPTWLDINDAQAHRNATAALKAVYDDLTAAAVNDLHWANGDEIFQEDPRQDAPYWEMTVKGTHPNALGMFHFTTFWTPRLAAMIRNATTSITDFVV